MASRGSDNGSPAPVNDSIDDLLDGLPAEPMLPKKRAKPIDRNAPHPSDRRSDAKVVVNEGTDPRERARLEAENSRRASSTFGTGFVQTNATPLRVVVAVLMMLAVLGIYALVRHSRADNAPVAHPTVAQPTSPSAPSGSTAAAIPTDVLPPVPSAPAATAVVTATSGTTKASAAAANDHRAAKPHGDVHAPPAAPAAPPSASANTRTDVARSL